MDIPILTLHISAKYIEAYVLEVLQNDNVLSMIYSP